MRRAETTTLRAASWVLGALPAGLGQFRIAHDYWHRRRPPHRLAVQRMVRGPRMCLDLGDRTQAIAYLTRRYSQDLVAEIVQRLPPQGGTFVDVGANVGLVTFQVAHRRPATRIVAIEPSPAAVALWRRNRALSGAGDATIEAVAVTSAVGTVGLLAPDTDLGAGRLTDDGGGLAVPGTTLDAYCAEHGIARIDVLKLDVEGSEPDVLDGADRLLAARAIGAVVVELNDVHLSRRGLSRDAVIDRLAAHGLLPATSREAGDVVFDLA